MKVNFLINDPSIDFRFQEKYELEYPAVPRIGETVIIHREQGRSDENKFTVEDVIYIIETRDWYLKQQDPVLNHNGRVWIYLKQKI